MSSSSNKKSINPILESMGPDVITPKIQTQNQEEPFKDEKYYRILNEKDGSYDILDELKYDYLKTHDVEKAKKAERFIPTEKELKMIRGNKNLNLEKESIEKLNDTETPIDWELPHYRYYSKKDKKYHFITESRYNRFKNIDPEIANANRFDKNEIEKQNIINNDDFKDNINEAPQELFGIDIEEEGIEN